MSSVCCPLDNLPACRSVSGVAATLMPLQALQYRPKGRRNIGWPKKR